jgi:hypothetical protein
VNFPSAHFFKEFAKILERLTCRRFFSVRKDKAFERGIEFRLRQVRLLARKIKLNQYINEIVRVRLSKRTNIVIMDLAKLIG